VVPPQAPTATNVDIEPNPKWDALRAVLKMIEEKVIMHALSSFERMCCVVLDAKFFKTYMHRDFFFFFVTLHIWSTASLRWLV
jgi:hypothetical protein